MDSLGLYQTRIIMKLTKLKAFADEKINITEKNEVCIGKGVENIVIKVENTG